MPASSAGSKEGVVWVVPETDEIVAVCLEGEFDMANTRTVGEEIDRTLAGGKDLIFDLSEATFIDSSLIAVLIRAVKATRGTEQAVVLQLGTTAIVERVLEITRIEQVVPRAHDRQEAVRMIRQRAKTG